MQSSNKLIIINNRILSSTNKYDCIIDLYFCICLVQLNKRNNNNYYYCSYCLSVGKTENYLLFAVYRMQPAIHLCYLGLGLSFCSVEKQTVKLIIVILNKSIQQKSVETLCSISFLFELLLLPTVTAIVE